MAIPSAATQVRSAQVVCAGPDLAEGRAGLGVSARADGLHVSREATWVSSPRDTGATFSAIGPHWRGAPGVAVELAVSPDGTRWSDWMAVPREGTIEETRENGERNPFAGESVGALAFVTPNSRWVRFRLRLPATPDGEAALASISFQVIDPGPSDEIAPSVLPGVRIGTARRARAPLPELPDPAAGSVRPEYSSRAAWGARSPVYGYTLTLAGHVGIHHTASVEDFAARSWGECAARMRAIQAFHMDTNGWNDIGYAWAVCPHGDVFQGREDDDDATDVQGAHDGFNRGSTGITLFGYFHPPVNHQPTEAQLSALVDLVAWIARLRGIDPLGRSLYEAFGAPVDNVYGHREVKATDCPGDHLFALKERIRRSAAEKAFLLAL